MDLELIDKLEKLITDAIKHRERAAKDVEKALKIFDQASNDISIFEKTLERYMEGIEKPYQPKKLPVPSFMKNLSYASGSDKKNSTKMGVLRNVFRESSGPLAISQILEAIPENVPFVLTRDDLYKMLTKLVRNREINKVAAGLYERAK